MTKIAGTKTNADYSYGLLYAIHTLQKSTTPQSYNSFYLDPTTLGLAVPRFLQQEALVPRVPVYEFDLE